MVILTQGDFGGPVPFSTQEEPERRARIFGRAGTPLLFSASLERAPISSVRIVEHKWERLMVHDDDHSLRDILLFVSGLGAGGFLTAILFAMAVSGGFMRFT